MFVVPHAYRALKLYFRQCGQNPESHFNCYIKSCTAAISRICIYRTHHKELGTSQRQHSSSFCSITGHSLVFIRNKTTTSQKQPYHTAAHLHPKTLRHGIGSWSCLHTFEDSYPSRSPGWTVSCGAGAFARAAPASKVSPPTFATQSSDIAAYHVG